MTYIATDDVRWVFDEEGRARPIPTPWRPNNWTPDEVSE